MFSLQRQEILGKSEWEPQEGDIEYIETWYISGTDKSANSHTYESGKLTDADVEDWLHRQSPPTSTSDVNAKEPHAHTRLMLCERKYFHPLTFSMSEKSYLAVENAFDLPIDTLTSFHRNGGRHSFQFQLTPEDSRKARKLYITLKVPQMYQVANFGLSLCHNFDTRTTNAFIFGWNVIHERNWRKCLNNKELPEYLQPHGKRISENIRRTISLQPHPLTLPLILLEEHSLMADKYKGMELSAKVMNIEEQLRVTKAGRIDSNSPLNQKNPMTDTKLRRDLTSQISTEVTNCVNLVNNLKWDIRFCQALEQASRDIQRYSDQDPAIEQEIEETISILAADIASTLEYVEGMKARLDVQLSVLYNFVAQADSSLNASIATSAGLDSVAMKALAFVTTVFLPPTFLATLFSMSMFDWQSNDYNGIAKPGVDGARVSSMFWLYWALCIPLTLFVLLCWLLWWKHAKKQYAAKYNSSSLDLELGDESEAKYKLNFSGVWTLQAKRGKTKSNGEDQSIELDSTQE